MKKKVQGFVLLKELQKLQAVQKTKLSLKSPHCKTEKTNSEEIEQLENEIQNWAITLWYKWKHKALHDCWVIYFFPQISLLKMDTYKVRQPRRMNYTHYSLTSSALNLKEKKNCGEIKKKNILWSNLDKAFLNITLKILIHNWKHQKLEFFKI